MDSCGGVGGGGVNNSVAFLYIHEQSPFQMSVNSWGFYSLALLALSISCSKSNPKSMGSNGSIRSAISTS